MLVLKIMLALVYVTGCVAMFALTFIEYVICAKRLADVLLAIPAALILSITSWMGVLLFAFIFLSKNNK
jgi:hypothetical protein